MHKLTSHDIALFSVVRIVVSNNALKNEKQKKKDATHKIIKLVFFLFESDAKEEN